MHTTPFVVLWAMESGEKNLDNVKEAGKRGGLMER
jgi:hypothetical protein